MAATCVADSRRTDMIGLCCQQDGEPCHRGPEFAKLLAAAYPGKQFLQDDPGHGQRGVVDDEFSQCSDLWRLIARIPQRTAKDERQDRGIQNDHRFLLSAL